LLPQDQNLGLKRNSRPETIREHPPDESAQVQHHATASPDSQSTTSRIWFAVGTADYYNSVQTHLSLNDDAPEELGRFLATIGSPDRLAEHRTRKKSSTALVYADRAALFFVVVLASRFKSKLRLEAENAMLRHQLIVLGRLHGRVRYFRARCMLLSN
jgi:hypothetical protein